MGYGIYGLQGIASIYNACLARSGKKHYDTYLKSNPDKEHMIIFVNLFRFLWVQTVPFIIAVINRVTLHIIGDNSLGLEVMVLVSYNVIGIFYFLSFFLFNDKSFNSTNRIRQTQTSYNRII